MTNFLLVSLFMSFFASTIIFTVSSLIWLAVYIYALYTDGVSAANVGNVMGYASYLVAYIVYAVAEYKSNKKQKQREWMSDLERLPLLMVPHQII